MLIPEVVGTGMGIYVVQLNNDTGELKILHTEYAVNPSYLAVSDDNEFLYCSTEVAKDDVPMVQAYKVNDDFSLRFLNEQPITGGFPCHIEKFLNSVFVACYETGNILQFPVETSGKLMPWVKNHQHYGSSSNKERQEGPHAHQVIVHPNKKQLFACDLGIDTVKAYYFKGEELLADKSKDIYVKKGGGPRHMVFSSDGKMAYVVNELSGDVSVLKFNSGKFEQVSVYRSLPIDYNGTPSASAIRIHPNGALLYVANRILDAITIFEIRGERLEVLDYQYTKGKELREFNITPNGKWLIACHQNSDDTVVYHIKPNGKLTEKYRTNKIKTPVCITFLT